MKWKVLAGGTIISVCASVIWRLYPNNQVISSIVMSIIAAYIFYFPIEFVPSLLRDYEKRPSQIIAYRRLQLLLVRLDDIAITMYNAAENTKVEPEKTMRLEEFYEPNFLESYIKKVNLKEHSNVSAFDGRTLTYCESIISSWNVVFELASNLLMMPVVQEDAELMFQLNYLVTESVLHTIFDLSKNMDISDIRPECYYGLNQIGDDVQKNMFDNILQLHYLANKYYKKLEKYKENCKYKGMINKPIFYKE